MRIRAALLACAAFVGVAGLTGTAVSADDFYKGKTVRVIIGYTPGGSYDVYARIMARHLGHHLPGNPDVIAQNMPGAGSLKAVNYLYNTAPNDGTVFGTFGRTMPLLPLMSGSNARFDSTKLTWIGTPTSYADDAYLMVVRSDGPLTSVTDLRKQDGNPLILGTTAIGTTGTDISLVLRQVLGINVKLLSGYSGGHDINLAIERREVDGRMLGMSSIKSAKPEWLTSRKIMTPILQFARETRHPELPDVPLASELATNAEDKALIQMMELPFLMANPFAAPPGLSPERTKVLRDGFHSAVSSKEHRAEASKLGMDVSPKTGEEVQAMVGRIYQLPKAVIQRYEDILANPKIEPRKVNWIVEKGQITKLASKNRNVTFDHAGTPRLANVAGDGYTTVTINGKPADEEGLKVGMTCEITYEGDKTAAQKIVCD